MSPRKLVLLLALLVLPTLCACSSSERWYEVPVRGLADEDLYEKCLLAVQLADLKVEKSDLATGRIETQWDVNLVPFYRPRGQGGAGFRRRAFIEIEGVSEAPPEVRAKIVRVRCERERNAEQDHPANPAKAQWVSDSDDVNTAQKLAVIIKERTTPFTPSEDFYRRHGGEKEGEAAATSKPKNP